MKNYINTQPSSITKRFQQKLSEKCVTCFAFQTEMHLLFSIIISAHVVEYSTNRVLAVRFYSILIGSNLPCDIWPVVRNWKLEDAIGTWAVVCKHCAFQE